MKFNMRKSVIFFSIFKITALLLFSFSSYADSAKADYELWRAIYYYSYDNIEAARKALENGADVTKPIPAIAGLFRNQQKKYHIHFASSPEMISLLLEAGANVNATDIDGNNILNDPSGSYFSFDQEASLRVLKEAGINLNNQNNDGNAPVHSADASLTRLLAEAGAKLNIKNNNEDAPLHVLDPRKRSDFEKAQVLLNSGADASIKDKDGRIARVIESSNFLAHVSRADIEHVLGKAARDGIITFAQDYQLSTVCRYTFSDPSDIISYEAPAHPRKVTIRQCGQKQLCIADITCQIDPEISNYTRKDGHRVRREDDEFFKRFFYVSTDSPTIVKNFKAICSAFGGKCPKSALDCALDSSVFETKEENGNNSSGADSQGSQSQTSKGVR